LSGGGEILMLAARGEPSTAQTYVKLA